MRSYAFATAFLFALFATAGLAAGPPAQAADTDAAPAAYCAAKGGKVLGRTPYFNTNAPEKSWLRLNGAVRFCAFTAKDGSRLELLLSTLVSTQPTLAALAYYAKQPLNQKTCSSGASPGSCYCNQLGGTDAFGGNSVNGGGWVNKSQAAFTVLDACIFPDLSSIDAFALFYHSSGVIRGKNLNGILKYPDPFKK